MPADKYDYPDLFYFLRHYFVQTWQEVWGPEPEDPLQKGVFVIEDPSKVHAIANDVARFLESNPDDDDVNAFVARCQLATPPDRFKKFLREQLAVMVSYER